MDEERPALADISVPEGRDRLGGAHQLRVDISIAISMAPAWLRRTLGDRDVAKARGARVEFVERIAQAIERRFRVTWLEPGTKCTKSENARPIDCALPLFGGPAVDAPLADDRIDGFSEKEHIMNIRTDGVV